MADGYLFLVYYEKINERAEGREKTLSFTTLNEP